MDEEERCKQVRFAVYYNNMNPHVNIHKIGIHKLEKNGGNHEHEQGGWGYFVEEREAILFAEAICKLNNHLNVKKCKWCSKV